MPDPPADPVRDYDRHQTALQLVREAYELFVDPDSRLDLRDWTRAAKKLLQEHGQLPAVTATKAGR